MPAALARSCEIKIDAPVDGGQWRVAERSVRKNKKNLMIKELRSLDMKYYLATGGLSSIHQPYNNIAYPTTSHGINPISYGWLLDKYFVLSKGNFN